MPAVGGTTETEIRGFYSCPPGDYSVREKNLLRFYFSLNENLAMKGGKVFSQNSSNLTKPICTTFKKFWSTVQIMLGFGKQTPVEKKKNKKVILAKIKTIPDPRSKVQEPNEISKKKERN